MNISSRITDTTPLPGLRLLAMKTVAKDIVTITGSLLGGSFYAPSENRMIAGMSALLLDEGTLKRTKIEIREALESVGASIGFGSDSRRITFSAHCLKKDAPLVVELLAEQLREPAFAPAELDIEKKRTIGDLQEAKGDTRARVETRLVQLLYPPGHPNHRLDFDARMGLIGRITPEEVNEYHRRAYGLGALTVAVVGDVDGARFAQDVKRRFSGWQTSPLAFAPVAPSASQPAHEYVTLHDKANVDFRIGQALGITRTHPDFYPLMVGIFILGGNFAARLMQTVRDQQGLTYGVRAMMSGMDGGDDGYFKIGAIFAPELLKKGEAAIMEQVRRWVDGGVTAQELKEKQDTLAGEYQVGLATTEGMAGAILEAIERGEQPEYLDRIPDIIRAITLDDVNRVIRQYINPDRLVIAAAGSLDPSGNPLEKK